MNKKAQSGMGGMILIAGIIFLVLIIGFVMVLGSSVLRWVSSEVSPSLENLGVVGNTNLTDVARYTIHPVSNIIDSLKWWTGVIYVMMLVGCMGLSFIIRANPNKWLIGFFFLLVLLLIVGSILISNMYQSFYEGNTEMSALLNENIIMSYMMLYAPMIVVILAFICGIIMFSGRADEEVYV